MLKSGSYFQDYFKADRGLFVSILLVTITNLEAYLDNIFR